MKTDKELWKEQIRNELKGFEFKFIIKINDIWYTCDSVSFHPIGFLTKSNGSLHPIGFLTKSNGSLFWTNEIPITSTIEVYEFNKEQKLYGSMSPEDLHSEIAFCFKLIKTIKFQKPKTHAEQLRECISNCTYSITTQAQCAFKDLANKWEAEEK